MERKDFIKWLETCTEYKNVGSDDSSWEFVYDSYYDIDYYYLDISDEDVLTFKWLRKYWGGSDWQEDEYNFEDFKRRFEENSLTDY